MSTSTVSKPGIDGVLVRCGALRGGASILYDGGMTRRSVGLALAMLGLSLAPRAHADDVLRILEVRLERPTVHVLGVQVLVSDDDDLDATVTVRVRRPGGAWREATPLYRVRPEHVPETVRASVPAQLAGSVFDLAAGTDYELELHAVDPDGTDEIRMLSARTRPVPMREAASARRVPVTDAASLRAALAAAAPGDVIELANGTYAGSFSIGASGTAERPIVIRGATRDGVILDGQGCDGCNVLEVYGSYVHVERLTIRAAVRALRFQGEGATGNVARWLRIEDVVHGIGSRAGQRDFYVCDNDLDGRLVWPWTFEPDAGSHWDDRGIDLNGDGHVIGHNRLRGFGDPIVNKTRLSRAWDVYGNDILDSYDGTELDEAAGNVRFFGNRWTNVMVPISLQPVFGGPAYVLRNVAFNAPEEQIKMKSLGAVEEPSGMLIWHNTFVSPRIALNLQTPITQRGFRIENNLFVGPTAPAGRTVDWTAVVVDGVFDHDGYYPDTGYWFGTVDGTRRVFATLAEARAAGVEPNGVALSLPIFEAGLVGPEGDGRTRHDPVGSFALAATSAAIDRGRAIPGVNAQAGGAGPDLGAWERGCPAPHYGPRPEGMEEALVAIVDCDARGGMPGVDAGTPRPGDDASVPVRDGSIARDGGPGAASAGCGCRVAGGGDTPAWLVLAVLAALLWRRSR